MKLIAKSIMTALLACLVFAPSALAGASDDLDTAIFMADTSGAQAAIAQGANVNEKDKGGITPLMETADLGRPEITRLLIEKGADVNAVDKNGYTPLMHAAATGRTEVAQILMDKGADINAKGKDGKTALSIAKEWMSTDIISMLEKAGAK